MVKSQDQMGFFLLQIVPEYLLSIIIIKGFFFPDSNPVLTILSTDNCVLDSLKIPPQIIEQIARCSFLHTVAKFAEYSPSDYRTNCQMFFPAYRG
jgi:hypothetical protein